MTVVINIEPKLEEQLRQEATKAGLDMNRYILNALQSQVEKKEMQSVLSNQEATLLKEINSGFSSDFWTEYRQLIKKRESAIIEPKELEQLIKMTSKVEQKNVERLKRLVALAQIRSVPLLELMQSLGIQSPGYA